MPRFLIGRWSITVIRWVARVWGVALFLLWGGFFVEHLQWFADPRQLPPASVFLTQGLHFALLAGLLLAWRWELLGGVVVLVSSLAFFGRAAGPRFPIFAATAAVPALLWMGCGWLSRRTGRPPGGATQLPSGLTP